ncbi:hypothetical protein BJ165DRAFT_1528670 [Panaeolus papilionaceus]|nr:hypothetical protein BJ165DRAFT_1528670 [Panaeolus papilionaceus]
MSSYPMKQYQTDNILAARNPSRPLSALDGRVAAYLQHHRTHYVVTTPNQNFVPLPPIGFCHVRLRANLCYGLEDHCQWPQFLAPKYAHLPTIPKRPTSDQDPLAILWWDPSMHNFVPSLTGIVTGLGSLVGTKLELLRVRQDSLIAAISTYTTSSLKPSDFATESAYMLQNRITNAFIRLSSLKTLFTEMVFNITEFQRHCLHLEGFLHYSTTYHPRLDSVYRNSQEVNNLVGAFTMDAESAQRLFHAGVPVWYVEEWDGAPLIRNVLSLVDMTMPGRTLSMIDHDPPFPNIYEGDMVGEGRYAAIYLFALGHLTSQNPFERRPTVNWSSIPQSSNMNFIQGLSESGASRRGGPSHPSSQQHPVASFSAQTSNWNRHGRPPADPNANMRLSGRNPFEPVDSTYSPYGIPAWVDAVRSVAYSRSTIADIENCDSRYVLPDPKLFLGSKNMHAYITTWLQIRMIWEGFIGTDGGALSSQEWRELLNLDLSKPLTGHSHTAQRRRKLYNKLVYNDTTPFATGVQVQLLGARSPSWEGVTYPASQPVPVKIVQQILWSLYKLNFHLEFIALDHRLTSELHPDRARRTDKQLFDRESAIQRCFSPGIFKIVIHPSCNVGLAANSLEERLEYLINAAKVMKSWPGCPELVSQLSTRRQPSSIGNTRGSQFKSAIAQFYCQQFWNQFGRAPQVPHRLFLPQ